MKILVRNLAKSTLEPEIRKLFEEFGKVQSCTIVLDEQTGLSKGFGFVTMNNPGEAKAAIKNLNGKILSDNKIRVKKSIKAGTKPN
jgi:RNA recognition motif-containing protein